MDNLEHKKIWSFKGDRNLNTNPLGTGDILDWNKFNYFVEVMATSSAGTGVRMTFNNDTSSNYRDYYMRGFNSTPSANVLDSQTYIDVCGSVKDISISRFLISGEEGQEKYVSTFTGDISGSNSFVWTFSQYWKDTINNLISIQFFDFANAISELDINIYQIPKTVNTDQYDLVDEVVDVDLNSASHVFSNLNGDIDEEYLITASGDNAGSVFYRLNSSATNNRVSMRMDNTNGTIGALKQTVNYDGFGQRCTVFAKSGRDRLCVCSGSKTSADQQDERRITNPDLVTNVTNIEAYGSVVVDKLSLYKKKPHKTIDPVPMDTLFEFEVDGDLSNGITLSGLQGDLVEGAIKIEFIGTCNTVANTVFDIKLNSATTYSYQYLAAFYKSATNFITADSGNTTNASVNWTVSKTSNLTMWIYPNSGQNRPILSTLSYYRADTFEDNNRFSYTTWNDVVSVLNTIDISLNNTDDLEGTIRISVPKGTTFTTKPILTVN